MDQYELFLAVCHALMLHLLPHFYFNVTIIIINIHNHPSCSISFSSFTDFAQRQLFFLISAHSGCWILVKLYSQCAEEFLYKGKAKWKYDIAYTFYHRILVWLFCNFPKWNYCSYLPLFLFHWPSHSVRMLYLHKLRN